MSISIVMPVYNVEKYLRKCLDSVCAQDDCVQEIILVNDGSVDASLEICRQYAEKDRRIKIISRENKGTSATIIEGIENASGSYIGFVDSDDFVEPNMFRKMFAAIEESDVDIAFCDYDAINENDNTVFPRDFGIGQSGVFEKKDNLFPISILPTLRDSRFLATTRWNKVIKRELLVNNIAFKDKGIKVGEDSALIIPTLMASNKIAYVKECLYHYVQRDNSIMHTYKKETLADWETVISIIEEAKLFYNYKFQDFNDNCLALLLNSVINSIRMSNIEFKQRKSELKRVGDNKKVRELLRSVKIKARFKKKVLVLLLKYRMYGLLAKLL